jgi:hypothetical protein
MHKLSPTDELADIRAEIARLRKREAVFFALIDAQPTPPAHRPGWPIRRDMQQIAVYA